jgi:hypothetical protein
LADRLERGQWPQGAVVVEAEVAVVVVRVLPGDHEDREPLVEKEFDERVLRPQVEDVILHDPSRDEQDGLGPHGLGPRLVLDELDQPVAVDDLARRHGQRLADLEPLYADRRPAIDGTLPVLEEVPESTHEVHAPLRAGSGEDLRVRQHEVRRREDVEHLPAHEPDAALVQPADAPDAGRGVVPPLLIEQERLGVEVERPALPFCSAEALVVRQRLDARRAPIEATRASRGVAGEPDRLSHSFFPELELLARRRREMDQPGGVGFGARHRRKPNGEAREEEMDRPVEGFREPLGRIAVLGPLGDRGAPRRCTAGRESGPKRIQTVGVPDRAWLCGLERCFGFLGDLMGARHPTSRLVKWSHAYRSVR